MPPETALLRRFQAQRLAQTHADLLSSPRFGPAARFFLSDVYGPRDFSQRDADLLRFYEGVRKVLPERAVAVLADVVQLSAMTNDLDERLIRALVDELGVTDAITLEQYAAAYRLCDNYDERLQQIQMIDAVGRGIERMDPDWWQMLCDEAEQWEEEQIEECNLAVHTMEREHEDERTD